MPPEFLNGPPPPSLSDVPPTAPAAKRTTGVEVLGIVELETYPEPDPLIDDFINAGDTSVFFGEPGVSKTFVTLGAAFCVALGWDWHGRGVEHGGVIYVAGEGAGGLRRRIRAFREHHGLERTASAAFGLVCDVINFRDKHEVNALAEAVKAASSRWKVPLRWIVVDTLSRALAGGNENAPEDMGALLNGAARLQAATGRPHVTFIHHSGKDDTRGARGHSSLKGAVDTEVKFERQDGGVVRVTATKQRDLEEGRSMAFKLRQIELGQDRRGRPVTSCVVEPAEIKIKLTEGEHVALEKLNTMQFETTETTVSVAAWRTAVMSRLEEGAGQARGTLRKQWQRIRDGLEKKRLIEVSGDRVLIRKGATGHA